MANRSEFEEYDERAHQLIMKVSCDEASMYSGGTCTLPTTRWSCTLASVRLQRP